MFQTHTAGDENDGISSCFLEFLDEVFRGIGGAGDGDHLFVGHDKGEGVYCMSAL